MEDATANRTIVEAADTLLDHVKPMDFHVELAGNLSLSQSDFIWGV